MSEGNCTSNKDGERIISAYKVLMARYGKNIRFMMDVDMNYL